MINILTKSEANPSVEDGMRQVDQRQSDHLRGLCVRAPMWCLERYNKGKGWTIVG